MRIKNFKKKNIYKRKRGFTHTLSSKVSGFTLIEIMVATSIFVVVMLVAMGSLIMTSENAKKAKALNFTMDNLSFAIESMTRNIRMGTDYYCSSGSIYLNESLGVLSCPSGSSRVAFKPAESFGSMDRVAYFINKRSDSDTYTIQRCTSLPNVCVDIISENINIDPNLSKFYVKGAAKDDNIQPSVYIKIKGSIKIKNQDIPFSIQTMTSQRTLD